MRKVYASILVLACLVLMTYGMKSDKPDTSMRTWTTLNGNTIKAKYIERKYGKVKLQAADNKFLMVNEKTLIEENRAWIKKTEKKRNAPAGIKPPSSPNKLPVFSGGDNNGYHAVYTAKNFDACMNINGGIIIYPKENGIRLKNPITFSMNCYFSDGTQHGRYIASFDSPSKPIKQPKALTLTGYLINNVAFSVTYEFSEKGIKGYGFCKDPNDIANVTMYRIMAAIPASHKFPKEMLRTELNKQMIGWHITIEPIKGDRRIYPYDKPNRTIGGRDKKLTIDAPAYGKRKIWFKAGKPEEAPIRPWVYNGNCLWQGYVVQMIKTENDKKSKFQYLQMIVE